MPTYLDLNREEWYRDQFEPPALAAFNERLRQFYGHTRAQTGSPGDNNHLKGRHRSINWCLNSIYCTNRAYGTTDQRDRRGNWDWYRATDIGITGPTLFAACKRLDEAVKAGRLLGLAEWFGTFDGLRVSGWFEGKPSDHASTSHLTHLHCGYWTEHADDNELFDLLFEVITGGGEDMPTAQEVAAAVWDFPIESAGRKYSSNGSQLDGALAARNLNEKSVPELSADLTALTAKVDKILTLLTGGGGGGTGGPVDLTPSALNEIRGVVDEELDEAFSAGADKDTP